MKIAEFNDYNKEYGQPELQKLLIKPYEFDIEKDSYFNGDEYHFGFNGNIYVSQSIGLTGKDYRLLNYPTITLITLHKESD